MGRMWPAKAFLAAHESFLNCKKCCKNSSESKYKYLDFLIDNYQTRIYLILQQNLYIKMKQTLQPTAIYVDNLALRGF